MSDSERRTQRLGREFVFALYAALRALRLYPVENQTVQSALKSSWPLPVSSRMKVVSPSTMWRTTAS